MSKIGKTLEEIEKEIGSKYLVSIEKDGSCFTAVFEKDGNIITVVEEEGKYAKLL